MAMMVGNGEKVMSDGMKRGVGEGVSVSQTRFLIWVNPVGGR